jgi:hypothetical protein
VEGEDDTTRPRRQGTLLMFCLCSELKIYNAQRSKELKTEFFSVPTLFINFSPSFPTVSNDLSKHLHGAKLD